MVHTDTGPFGEHSTGPADTLSGGRVQRVAPRARIVYVDNDAVVLAHARALLSGTPEGSTGYVDGDLRDPDSIVTEAAKTLDLGRPVAVYLANVLGQLASIEEMHETVRQLMAAMPAGSYLVIADGVRSPAACIRAQGVATWLASQPITRPRRLHSRTVVLNDAGSLAMASALGLPGGKAQKR